MKYLSLTFLTPEENLACDEALLEGAEAGGGAVLRIWEPAFHFVVLGFANKSALEADLPACEKLGIPVLRRCSGGGTILQGPGCLNYSLILPINFAPELVSVSSTNRFVMERHREAFARLVKGTVTWDGCTDLTLNRQKFSGNAQRRKRNSLLFHGTLLLHLDLDLVAQMLRMPSSQPDYRHERAHGEFLTNLGIAPEAVRHALREAWNARDMEMPVPLERIAELVRERYSRPEWNLRS